MGYGSGGRAATFCVYSSSNGESTSSIVLSGTCVSSVGSIFTKRPSTRAIWLPSRTIGNTFLSSVSRRMSSRRYSLTWRVARTRKTSIAFLRSSISARRSWSAAPMLVFSSSSSRIASFSAAKRASISANFASSSAFFFATSSSTLSCTIVPVAGGAVR